MKRDVLLTWISGLIGAIVGGLGGWWLGVMWAEATPDDPSEPFADLGTVFGSTLLGLVLIPLLSVFAVLRFLQISKPFLSSVVFLLTSAVFMALLVRIGTLLLPVDIGIQGGAVVVVVLGTFGSAIATRRVVR